MPTCAVLRAAVLGTTAMCFASAAVAQSAESDVGTLTRDKVEKIFPVKRPYSPYADRNFQSRR